MCLYFRLSWLDSYRVFLAIHGLALTQDNPLKVIFNTPKLLVHLQRLDRWHKAHYFRYGGRVDDATILLPAVFALYSANPPVPIIV